MTVNVPVQLSVLRSSLTNLAAVKGIDSPELSTQLDKLFNEDIQPLIKNAEDLIAPPFAFSEVGALVETVSKTVKDVFGVLDKLAGADKLDIGITILVWLAKTFLIPVFPALAFIIDAAGNLLHGAYNYAVNPKPAQ